MTPRVAAMRADRMARAPLEWLASGQRVLAIFRAARDKAAPGTPEREAWEARVAEKEQQLAHRTAGHA